MAYYFLFPEKDATIYSHPDRTTLNTGHDEIIEIIKEKGSSDPLYYPSRALIQFKSEDIQNVINDTITYTTFNTIATCSLQLLSTEHKNLTTTLNLEVFPISESWDEGSGRYSNLPTSSNGCSWIYRDDSVSKSTWPTGSSALGATFASSSITLGSDIPKMSGSMHTLTINGIDFIAVVSSSVFDASDTQVYFEISGSDGDDAAEDIDHFGKNLKEAINASSSLSLVSASYDTSTNILLLTGADTGSVGNITVITSSVANFGETKFLGDIYRGYVVEDPTADGQSANYQYRLQGGTDISVGGWAANTTGSISGPGITKGGGSWYSGSDFIATQQFLNASNLDTNFDVTEIIKKQYQYIENTSDYPTGIANNGFIIKQPDSIETNTSNSFGEMKYFSTDSHTIYPPRLIFKWDDSIHSSQSIAKQKGELNVSLYRNKEEYNQNDIATFRVHVRDKYPTRQFTSSSNFLNASYFTTSSHYSIRDAHTEEEVIPFDNNCTKMSADSEGMYFKIYMDGLQPERYYRLLFKHKNNEGTIIYDNNYHFKVIR